MQSSCPSLKSPAGFMTIRFQWKFSVLILTHGNFPDSQTKCRGVCDDCDSHNGCLLNLTLLVLVVDLFTNMAWFLGQSHVGYI